MESSDGVEGARLVEGVSMTRTKIHLGSILLSLFLFTAACGGGDGRRPAASTQQPPPTPPSSSGPTWTPGVYESASLFKDRCEVVRTGVDIEGNPFPDMMGSTLEENFWLRSWTHETYLWNDEVVDRNPADFNDRLSYFAVLRTTEKTASGKDKDDFHFSEPTEDFLASRNSTPRASYGASFLILSGTPPRDVRVRYTDPDTPASQEIAGQPNLMRGTEILEVDGVDVVNSNTQAAIDTLNDGLFPANAGEMHTFKVRDPGSASMRTIMMTSENLSSKPVNRTRIIDTASGKVGYILFNTFSPFASEEEIADAISAMKTDGVSDLILDLRYNGGGLLAVASQLSYMIAGDAQTSGKIFERLRFNDDAGNLNPVTGQVNQPVPFFNQGLGFSLAAGTPLQSLDLNRVFILSTDRTCSASEAVINGLRGIDVEVILIGAVTCGKPFGFFPTDNCGVTYSTIQFQGVNDKGFGDYADGFVPMNDGAAFGVRLAGCSVADDFANELGDESEGLLSAALSYRETGICPSGASTSHAAGVKAKKAAVSAGEEFDLSPPREDIFRTNRDMKMPD